MVERKDTHFTFSKSEALRFGWQMATKYIWFFVGMLLISNGLSWVMQYIYKPMIGTQDLLVDFLGIMLILIAWFVNLEIEFASKVLYFKIVDKKKTTLKELFAYFEWDLIFKYFLVQLIYTMVTVLGLILFIIPGLYFTTKYWFAPYIYVDKRTGVIEAFKESAKLTQGIKWQLFLLGLLQLLIQIGGLLALGVGLFVAVPINYLSDIYVYRKLSPAVKSK